MDTSVMVTICGAALTSLGIFMYSSRAVDIVQRHPVWRWPVGRQLLYLSGLGLVPEGLGLMLGGVATLMRQEKAGLFAFIAANLLVLGLIITRPDWSKPQWMRANSAPRP